MTRIVAIDTSTWWGGLALVEQRDAAPRTVAEIGVEVRDSHASHLFGWLEVLLREAGWSRDEVDGYVAVRGPGRFTGVRVALGTVRGFSLATERPAIGVDSLDAMVEAYGPAECERVTLLGAGRGEVYGARYDPGSSPALRLREPWLGPPEQALESGRGGAVILCGAGSEELVARFSEAVEPFRAVAAPRSIAAAAGRLALLRGLGPTPSTSGLAPLYIRLPDAELKQKRR